MKAIATAIGNLGAIGRVGGRRILRRVIGQAGGRTITYRYRVNLVVVAVVARIGDPGAVRRVVGIRCPL
jgi:hypothetical protein